MSLAAPQGSDPKVVTVVQGEFFVTSDPDVIITTVLGSCVSVCLFDVAAGIGGMNHFLLVHQGDSATDDLRYGVNAMELLINKVLQAGGERSRLAAKVFGGARIIDHAKDIGGSNARFACDFLQRESIRCVSQSLGGTMARRIRFYPTTGAAKQLQIAGVVADVEAVPPVKSNASDITLF
jgi:chemotaxis protein CheD